MQEEPFDETQSDRELLQKELSVNQAQQVLLEKRLARCRSVLNDLPPSDPQYNTLLAQVQMDQIELDELKVRASLLREQL